MKTLEAIKVETNQFERKTYFINRKEFFELPNCIDESELILNIIDCQKINNDNSGTSGLLILTDKRILYLSHRKKLEFLKLELSYSDISGLNFSNGLMWAKIEIFIDSKNEVFDYLSKSFGKKIFEILEEKSKDFILLNTERENVRMEKAAVEKSIADIEAKRKVEEQNKLAKEALAKSATELIAKKQAEEEELKRKEAEASFEQNKKSQTENQKQEPHPIKKRNPVDSFLNEMSLYESKPSYIKTKEFLELPSHINEEEKIIDILYCVKNEPLYDMEYYKQHPIELSSRIESSSYGILVITDKRMLFLRHRKKSDFYKLELDYTDLSNISYEKGLMSGKIILSVGAKIEEFDFIPNRLLEQACNIVKKKRKDLTELKKEEIIKQETNTELNALEKLQFKKFLAEQSGMNLSDVDEFLSGTPQVEIDELIRAFKKNTRTELANKSIADVKKSEPSSPQVMRVINEDASMPSCPKCKSKQVSYNKQGFGVGKAAVGVVLTGGIGLLAGGINKNKIVLTCLNCGNHWTK